MNEFHFSPRSNRAHEIAWQPWSAHAFETAQREDKPILLAISAVWCHWCHVMDETSYSDPAIIAAINERYVPVRVDNDRRPDVNARYNQGGWPTTAFLTPQGTLLAGATYMPPAQMSQALAQIADFYRENRDAIASRSAELRARISNAQPPAGGDVDGAVVEWTLDRLEQAYDEEYGGFGNEPKFPMTDALEFLLQEHRATGNPRAYEIVARSMLGMSTGGMYDHVEGGFFRYSTTRDWSVPHFEKMTEDHAALLRILATLVRTTRNDRFHSTLVSALGYVRDVLLDPRSHLFAGSQDADEHYFSLSLEERRKLRAPYVDRTSYSNWTAAMAATFVAAGNALGDDRAVTEGVAVLDTLHDRMLDTRGLLVHFIEPGGTPQVQGLLVDQHAYLRAAIDAHEYTGERRFLDRAKALAQAVVRHFSAPDGGFYDHAGFEEMLGNLEVRNRPLPENASLAESFVRLAALENQPRWREIAQSTLLVFANSYERAGIFAAPLAKAVRRYLLPEASVVLVGSTGETADLRDAAHALPAPTLVIRTIAPDETEALRDRGFEPSRKSAAYVCAGTVCGEPAHDPAALRDSFEAMVLSRAP